MVGTFWIEKTGFYEFFNSSSDENIDQGPVVEVKKDLELPEGATLSDSDSDHKTKDDPHRALDIDLEL